MHFLLIILGLMRCRGWLKVIIFGMGFCASCVLALLIKVSPGYVGSTQVPFLICTLEIPAKIVAQVLALDHLLFCFTFELLSQTMSISCIFVFAPSFIHTDLSIMQTQHP